MRSQDRPTDLRQAPFIQINLASAALADWRGIRGTVLSRNVASRERAGHAGRMDRLQMARLIQIGWFLPGQPRNDLHRPQENIADLRHLAYQISERREQSELKQA